MLTPTSTTMLRTPTSPHRTPHSADNKGWIYTEPVNGFIHRSLSLDALLGAVEKQRFSLAGKDLEVDLAAGWQVRFLDVLCSQNPSAPCSENRLDPLFEPPHVAIGRALWRELHLKASEKVDPYQRRDWFEKDWLNRVPDYAGCKCKSNAIQLINSMPPDYGDGFESWCEKFHQEISRRLGKKPWVRPSQP